MGPSTPVIFAVSRCRIRQAESLAPRDSTGHGCWPPFASVAGRLKKHSPHSRARTE
jgi:hypothetical protein